MGMDVGRYDSEIDTRLVTMTDGEYYKMMQSLNRKQSELVTHVVTQLEESPEQMFIFLEGGAGVGKTMCA